MNVIAHRGLWVGSALGNSWEALVSAMDQGFDIELDVRDHCGEVVIEHDPAFRDPLPLEKIFKRAVMYEASRKLYLNIKADGLADSRQRPRPASLHRVRYRDPHG